MVENCLVETDFLFSLNPNDRHHRHARQLLQAAAKGQLRAWLSPVAPIEASLILKSRGFTEDKVADILRSFRDAIQKYTIPAIPELHVDHLAMAAELRHVHSSLTFFDSIHVAIALSSPFIYVSTDAEARKVVMKEGGKARPLG